MLKAAAAKVYQTGLALMLGAAFALASPAALARKAPEAGVSVSGFETVSLADLPREGRTTYARILQGGPFPNDKDGTVFGNRERILPRQARGYYREYTVRTPGAKNRGARRIVCGGLQPQEPDACFYTGDHYNSFQQIVQ
ncbi:MULTISPECIES: ribonuclease domain-containing protein [Comamonas]|jgi:ribonuclease T1|uniref:ribonuclease domain-containing protein n=1 Tax=Comamonas TaxID=283 RepID=UPI0025CC7FAC|nr:MULTISPECIES: ribonuclease domain-containing protein [Comamonas]MDR3067250.1 ribonuclease N [Comamonas sp.]MEB5966197.1 ribonuclease N [Comamonas testosteroni]